MIWAYSSRGRVLHDLWQEGMAADSWNRKLRDHVFNHRHEQRPDYKLSRLSSSKAPSFKGTVSPNSPTSWGTRVQILEPMEHSS